MSFTRPAALLLCAAASCIAPSVVSPEDRAVELDLAITDWRPAAAGDVPGTYVSTELSGPLAASLRKVVYLFVPGGAYTGAGLIDDVPPRFESVSGSWSFGTQGLSLDGGPAATLEVAGDGSLRLTGAEGRIVFRRERER